MRITLLFERSDKHDSGWREHFFHFTWGYLFPSIREILRLGVSDSEKAIFEVETCGPVMDNITLEAASILNLNIRIVEVRETEPNSWINIPRWDKILRNCTDWYIRNQKPLPDHDTETILPPDVISYGKQFISDIYTVRNAFLSNTNTEGESSGVLIMKRSDEPAYYKPDGGAIRPTYGNSRRALTGVEDTVQELQKQGLRVQSFEPGKVLLAEQINVIHRSEGIIGIRGAEFSNLIWANPGTKVLMIEPTGMHVPGVQHMLAAILKQPFFCLKSDERTSFPKLTSDMITPYLPVNPS